MGKINYGPFTAGEKEWRFYREGMTREEFEREYENLRYHFDEWVNRTYIPLWKQEQIKEKQEADFKPQEQHDKENK